MVPSTFPPFFRVAFTAVLIFLRSLRASNMRRIWIPLATPLSPHRPIAHLIYLLGDREHVGGLKTRCQQGLMGIPQRCVGNQDLSSLCLPRILLSVIDVPLAMRMGADRRSDGEYQIDPL